MWPLLYDVTPQFFPLKADVIKVMKVISSDVSGGALYSAKVGCFHYKRLIVLLEF